MLLTGCGEFGVCETYMAFNLTVEVRDSATSAFIAWGSTGEARHSSGISTELTASDSSTLRGNWDRERPGRYTVTIRKPGYKTQTAQTTVEEEGCHVRTRNVQVSLARLAIDPEPPVSLTLGPHASGSAASAGVRLRGDTLEVSGSASAICSQLRSVAYRNGREMHIQLEPQVWSPASCTDQRRLQAFDVRYRLPAGTNYILVTNGQNVPTILFDGYVNVQ